MTPTATQSPTTPRCPHCGARMAPEQDWCLQCGNAATTRFVRPPSWRLPVAVGLGTLALLVLVVVLAIGAISDDADEAASGGSPAPAPATTPARTATATTPRPAQTQTATTPAPAVPTAGQVPTWPRGEEAYTVVVTTTSDRAGARRRARELIEDGQDAGVLRTDGYDFFSDGYWVVWSGRYPDREAAERAAPEVQDETPGAYVTLVRRRAGDRE